MMFTILLWRTHAVGHRHNLLLVGTDGTHWHQFAVVIRRRPDGSKKHLWFLGIIK